MEYTLTEQLLLLLADWQDSNRKLASWRLIMAMPGDPRLGKYRRWLEKRLANKKKRRKLYNAFQSLQRRGFFQNKKIDGKNGYILNFKAKLKITKIKALKVKKNKLPPRNYLIVFFDIPEKKKRVRDIFRRFLISLGFWQLQKSVWLTNFDTFRELEEFVKNFDLKNNVSIFFVNESKD